MTTVEKTPTRTAAPHVAPNLVSRRRRRRTARISSRALKQAGYAAGIGLALLMALYIGEYVSVSQAGREASALRAELRRARRENSNLRVQVQILERPQRLDEVARKMGMEQRIEADYVALAPLAPEPAAEKNTPVLAGFLPQGWIGRAGGR